MLFYNLGCIYLFIAARGDLIKRKQCSIRPIVKAVTDFIDIAKLQPGLVETVLDCRYGKVTRMLLAIESFLRGCSDDLAIHHQASGSILSLHDSIFSFVKLRPLFSLEIPCCR